MTDAECLAFCHDVAQAVIMLVKTGRDPVEALRHMADLLRETKALK